MPSERATSAPVTDKVVHLDARRSARVDAAVAEPAPHAGRVAGGARTIAVTSGKGGVGKTCITVNLARALARGGRRVLLIDADLGLANVDTLLGLHPRATLRQVIAGEHALEDVLLDGPGGIKIVPAASGFEDMARLGGREICFLLAQFDALARDFDVALIDTGAGISPAVLCFALAADEKLIVTTPEPTALTDAYALLKVLATRYGERDPSLIVNQARSAADAARTRAHLSRVTERFLGLVPRFLGHLPYDPELAESVRRQQAVVDFAPRAPVSLALQELAARIAERLDSGIGAQRAGGLLRRAAAVENLP